MFLVSVTRIFKTASVVKPLFSKVREIAAFYSSVEKSITWIGMFRKVDLLVISRNSGLLSAGFHAVQNELLTMFLKMFWKFWKNSRKSFVMEFLLRKLQAYKLQTSGFCIHKVLENSNDKDYSGVPFYRSRRYRLSSQIAVLNSFLEISQGDKRT